MSAFPLSTDPLGKEKKHKIEKAKFEIAKAKAKQGEKTGKLPW